MFVNLPAKTRCLIASACFSAVAFGSASSAVGQTASAAELQVEYMIIDQSIIDVFSMIERDTGVRIRSSGEVRGRVQRRTLKGPVVPALTSLAAAHDLDMFEFGGTVHVSSKDESTLRLVRLNGISQERALRALSDAGLQFASGDARSAANGSAIALTGPPRMLAIAEAIFESIPPARSPATATIRVRRGVTMELQSYNGARTLPQLEPEATDSSKQADNG